MTPNHGSSGPVGLALFVVRSSQHLRDHELEDTTPKMWSLRRLMKWLVVLAMGALVALAVIWITQRRLIYFPTQAVPNLSTLLAGVEEVTLTTADGLSLTAWYLPAADGGNGGTVVVFNGNAGNRAHRIPLAEAFSEAGYAVLLVDYRGYGGNPGSPSEEGLALDARAAGAYLETRSDVDSSRVAYFGESLGAAVAVGLAQHREPAALVLRSPFTSMPDIGSYHYPFLPTSLLLWDRYPNLEMIGGIDVPVMVIAGTADSIVPVEQSRELYEAAPEPKQLLMIEGADHNDLALTAGARLMSEVVAFLDDVLHPDNG